MKQSVLRLAVCLIACVFLSGCLFSCKPMTEESEPLFPDAFESGAYIHNPRALLAVKSGEKTIRVSFSQPVRGSDTLTSQVYYQAEGSEPIAAASFRGYGFVKDGGGMAYADVYEFDFPIPIQGGQILFAEQESDGDLAIGGLLYAVGGAGLYAEEEGQTALDVTIDNLSLPEEEVRMIEAGFTDREKGMMQMTFTVPVRCLGDWRSCVFVSDISNPNPGVAGSWQYGISSAEPIDAVVGEDGKTYAKAWRITVSGDVSFLPVQGVVRISENDSGAPGEYASANDNADCGRVVVAIDGRPLLADFIHGWDVSFAPYAAD
ncbi:MAG: hypothetical protein E7655_03145 [Ruminococcaceae bacterium]|nr:hypothetical protein [Oscillospiraceae bacterium]